MLLQFVGWVLAVVFLAVSVLLAVELRSQRSRSTDLCDDVLNTVARYEAKLLPKYQRAVKAHVKLFRKYRMERANRRFYQESYEYERRMAEGANEAALEYRRDWQNAVAKIRSMERDKKYADTLSDNLLSQVMQFRAKVRELRGEVHLVRSTNARWAEAWAEDLKEKDKAHAETVRVLELHLSGKLEEIARQQRREAKLEEELAETRKSKVLIGLSLSFCVADIIRNNIELDDVMAVICGFECDDKHTLREVIDSYVKVYWSDFPEEAAELTLRLWDCGKLKSSPNGAQNIVDGHWIRGKQTR